MGTKSDLCEMLSRTKKLESHVDKMRLTLHSIEQTLRFDDGGRFDIPDMNATYTTPMQIHQLPPYHNPVKLTSCGCLCELCSKCKK